MVTDYWRAVLAAKRVLRHLAKVGWFRSVRAKAPVDAGGRELPFYTYAMIRFLGERLSREMDVFEYGSGNSTLWYAARVRSVVAVENSALWAERVRARASSRKAPADVLHVDDTGPEYQAAVERAGRRFHLICLDGRNRNLCARHCLPFLREDGVVLFDDTQREKYAEGCRFLESSGFRRLDFWGLKPVEPTFHQTTLFYRPDNVLGI